MSTWEQFKPEFAKLAPLHVQALQGKSDFQMHSKSVSIKMTFLGAGAFGRVWKVLFQ
jgi:hypothetical protein